MDEAMKVTALELQGVSKTFGGEKALDDVSLRLEAGEVRALVGQNGSGKSTLVKILTGYHAPDQGARIQVWGEELSLPIDAPQHHGIAVIHQDLGLCEELTVTENFGVGSSYGVGKGRPVRWRGERRRCRELCERFGVDISPDALVVGLSPSQRAMLAIVRAIRQLDDAGDQQLFILDEPTTYLAREAAVQVTDLIRRVADAGAAALFVSHRLAEVKRVSDRISVLRDGKLVDTVESDASTEASILELMLGRSIGDFYPAKVEGMRGEEVLQVENLSGNRVESVSFAARRGEILGVTGLVGMGHDELPYLIVERSRRHGGTAVIDGTEVGSPAEAIGAGAGLVPANRLRDSVWAEATAAENMTIASLPSYTNGGRIDYAAERHDVAELVRRFQVQPPRPQQPVTSFSGGNQQKIVLAKWLKMDPTVLLLHEPTQGVDAGARKAVLELVCECARQGASVVIFSADYEQLDHLCTRVLVLQHGSISATLEGDDLNEANIVRACQGLAVAA
jgi:ribose transport system ATP-binding protein